MLSPDLTIEAWAIYMLVGMFLYFLPRSLLSRRLAPTSMSQGLGIGFQTLTLSKSSPADTLDDSLSRWFSRMSELSIYISIYKVCLVVLYLVTFILFSLDSYAMLVGAQLRRILCIIFLLRDTVSPVFIHVTILTNCLSHGWSRLYLHVILPLLLPTVIFLIYCELATHSMQAKVFLYSSYTANSISCVLQSVYLFIECALLYSLFRRFRTLERSTLQSDLCLLSSYKFESSALFRSTSLALSLSNSIYGFIIYRTLNLLTLLSIFCGELHPSIYCILITIKFISSLTESPIARFTDKPASFSLPYIIMNPALFKLFLRYSSHTTQALESLLFLYDASLCRLQILNAQTVNYIKESILTLNSRWFQDTQYFPPKVTQKSSEKVLTLLLRSSPSMTLSDLQREALELLSLPEKHAYSFLDEVVIPAFYRSSLGMQVLIINILLCKLSHYDGSCFKKMLSKALKRYEQEEQFPTITEMLESNPLIAFIIPDILSCITSDTTYSLQSNTQFKHISTQIGYFGRRSCFFKSCLLRQLSNIVEYILNTKGPDSITSKRLISSIEELEYVDLQHRLFSLASSFSLEYIKQIIHPIAGARNRTSYKNILSKCNPQSTVLPTRDSSLLLCFYTSLSSDSTDLTKSVDEFLSTTFCPRPSFDNIEKFKEIEGSNNRLNLDAKPFIGNYLVKQIIQLKQPIHALFKDLDEREKRNFRNLCIPKHAFFNTEAFILSLNSYVDCSFWPLFQDESFCGTKTLSFQFAHSRDGTEKSPRMILRAATVSPKKHQVMIISNHIKLFRLIYSVFHHLDLITDFHLPPGAISTLCLWLTSDETNIYYNSSIVIYFIRTAFLFLYSIEHDAPGFLPRHAILAMLLSVLCSTYKHPGLSNSALISSAHWLADLYADHAPSTSFCTAAGWISIVQSGLLAHSDLITRKRIRSFYLIFSKSFSNDISIMNYHDVLQSLTNKHINTELEAFKIKLCNLFISFLTFSVQAYNKATSLHLSVSKHLDLEKGKQLLFYIMLEQGVYQNKHMHLLETITLYETAGLTSLSLPILMLLKESLNFISVSYQVPFEYVFRQVELFIRHTSASANMWSCMLK